MMKSARLASLAMSIAVTAAAAYAFAPRELPAFEASLVRADRLHVNSIARAGSRLVAAGEAGNILVSDDAGASWHRASVAGQSGSTLNKVLFTDERRGIAIGHDGVVLLTENAGSTWRQVRFDGDRSEPLLNVVAVAGSSGQVLYAVGSFGRFIVSRDGGERWEDMPAMPDVGEAHLNALVAGPGNRLMLAGENGLLLRSPDGGAQWERLNLPYKGSMFGALALTADTWLVFGMRGNVLRSEDFGTTWEAVQTGLQTSFFGATRLQDGRIVLAGQGGAMLVSNDLGKSFRIHRVGGMASLTSILEIAPNTALVGGESGIAVEKL
ncbi:MAG TPA: YCF48-related protein [Noviherbaspirillum sp.]|nr:YCF48-related protein [Noviherbaspirillum sp.]